jgi:endonuclease III
MLETVIQRLREAYPQARCSLNFASPLQALIAVMLSAQCRDERVNQVTDKLFARFMLAGDLAAASQEEMESHLQSLGLYRNKANNLRRIGAELVERYGGQVPDNLNDLMSLPGVGRKTALCVLQEAFGQVQGIVVDTHVARLSRRLGWSSAEDVRQIENDLTALIPVSDWAVINHLLIAHGRAVCVAGRPRCPQCVLRDLCPSAINS